MITCPKCGKQLADGTKFCGGCGTPVSGIQTGGNTGSGNPAGGMQAGVFPAQKSGKKIKKEVYLFGGIGAGAVCVLILVVALIFFLRGSGTDAADYAFYVKDGELFFADLSDPEPWQITSRLAESGADNEELAYAVYAGNVSVSRDGKTIFYPERIDFEAGECSLYCRRADRPGEEPVRIDTGVEEYVVKGEGMFVVYRKNDVLYYYDVKKEEKTKIDDVYYDYSWEGGDLISEDGKVWYLNKEGMMYCWYQGKKEKIESDYIDLSYISENQDWILYRKDGNLYRKEYGKDRQRIASDVYRFAAYETGEIYYFKEEGAFTLMDFVRDDMGTRVENPNAPREWLSEQEVAKKYSLYYYDGEKETKIQEGLLAGYGGGETYPALALALGDDSGVERMKLSEIQNAGVFYNEVSEALNDPEGIVYYIVLKDKATEIGKGFRVSRFLFDADGEAAYFIDEEEDTRQGDLYRVEIAGGKVQKPEVFDQDVMRYNLYINGQGQAVYFKDYDEERGRGDLYIDGKLVDYEVNAVRYVPDLEKSFYFVDNMLKACAGDEPEEIGEVAEERRSYDILADGSVVCFYDYNSEYGGGDLGLYREGKLEEIDQDVYTYQKTGDAVLYLRDYSRNYYRGDLYLYRDGESEKLDEDVVNMFIYSVR